MSLPSNIFFLPSHKRYIQKLSHRINAVFLDLCAWPDMLPKARKKARKFTVEQDRKINIRTNQAKMLYKSQ